MARPNIQLGKDVSFTIAAGTDNGLGTVTYETPAIPMTAKAKSASLRLMRETERSEALDFNGMNYVPILDGWELSITGITWKTVGGNPLINKFVYGALARIVLTTPDKTYTFRGILEELSMDFERGENLHTLRMVPIVDGFANPTIA